MSSSGSGRPASLVWVGAVAVSATAFVVWWWAAGRGFDFTDEGYYLNVITHPADEVGTVLWFGHVYHPLFALLDWDLVALRRASLLITVGLGCWSSWQVLKDRGIAGVLAQTSWTWRLAASSAIGGSALLIQAQVPGTPSYNTLTLQSLLAVVGGLALARGHRLRPFVLGWGLVGAGVVGVALAKPTSVVVLVILLIAFLAVSRPPHLWRDSSIAVLAGGVVGSVFLVSAGLTPARFARVTRSGVDLATILGGHTQFLRQDPLNLPRGVGAVGIVLAIAGVSTFCLLCLNRAAADHLAVAVMTTMLCIAVVAGAMLDGPRLVGRMTYALTVVLGVTAVMTITAIVRLVVGRQRRYRAVVSERPKPHETAAWCVLLLALPLVYVFGTNTNYWNSAARGVIFWLLSCAVCLGACGTTTAGAQRLLGPLTLVFAVASGGMAVATTLTPYRADPLVDANVATEVGPGAHRVQLPPATALSVRAAREAAREAGLTRTTRVLDLTGASPGLIWALGAEPVGQGWVIGGYSGSESAAARVVTLTGCDVLKQSWILTAPAAPRSISASVLQPCIRDLSAETDLVTRVPLTPALWGSPQVPLAPTSISRPR